MHTHIPSRPSQQESNATHATDTKQDSEASDMHNIAMVRVGCVVLTQAVAPDPVRRCSTKPNTSQPTNQHTSCHHIPLRHLSSRSTSASPTPTFVTPTSRRHLVSVMLCTATTKYALFDQRHPFAVLTGATGHCHNRLIQGSMSSRSVHTRNVQL